MNGVQETPERAAQSRGMVRLVSLGASAALIALGLFGLASLRYAPVWDETDAPSVAVLGAIEPPPPAPQRPQSERRAPRVEAPDAPIEPPPQTDPAPSEPILITQPTWLSRPRNLARFYPREAFMRGVSGQAVLDCIVETTGQLTCIVESETPPEQGFGDAALAIAAAHLMQPAALNGAPVRGRYRMIVPFTAG